MHLAKTEKVEGPEALKILNPKLHALLTRALEAVQANDLVTALRFFGQCADIDPFNKAVLYFGSDAAQRAYFSLRYADPPAPEDKIAQWRHAAFTLTAAASEADPSDPVAMHNAGRFLHDDGQEAEAIMWYRNALAIKRVQAATWGNLGTCLYTMGATEEAEVAWSKCVAFPAETPSDTLAQAYIWLRRGDYLRGWKALNARWNDPIFTAQYGRPDLGGQMWTGQPLKKKDTLMLHGEQGLGDHVQFARYVVELLARGYNVVGLETRAPLKRWFEQALAQTPVVVYVRDADTLPGFTHHAPLLSLPGLLGMEDIPLALAPFDWTDRILKHGATTRPPAPARVGLIWKGTSGNPIDTQRSIPDHFLGQFADIPNITWVPLQYDPTGTTDLTARAWLGKNVEPTPTYRDVLGLAEVMAGLDSVVAVDTLGAHVAGSLGVPTLCLHRHNLEWRWGQAPVFANWYPSVTHLVQPGPRDWASVLTQVRERLSADG